MQKIDLPKKAMPPKFLQFAPELPQFTYLLLCSVSRSSRCKPIFINSSCLPLVPSSASDLGTDVNDLPVTTQSPLLMCIFPHRLAPVHADLQPKPRVPEWYGPKVRRGGSGAWQAMHKEKSRKLDPKVCDEIKPHCSVTALLYNIFTS